MTTDMDDFDDFELELSGTRIEPRLDLAHKAALRNELLARVGRRRASPPLITVAIAIVMLGATFVNQPALESTALRLDNMQILDGGIAALSTSRDARSGFSMSRSNAEGERVPFTSDELDDLRVQMEQLEQSYLEGLLPMVRAFGLTYEGRTEYHLAYGGEEWTHTFPVTIGEIVDNEPLQRFFLSPRYREICAAAYRGTLGPAPTDTLMLNGTPVAFSSWQFEVPEGGTITYHYGTPLN